MKLFLNILLCIAISNGISAQGLTKYGESTSTSTNFVNKNGKIGSNPELSINGQWILNIGDSYQGGIIAYILQPGDPGYIAEETHGLIAAPSDQSTGIFWHATADGITGATGTAIGTGNANTNAIIALYSTESNAAKLCADLVLGGYSDWYLPSKDELNKLYINKVAIDGFANDVYWSSSEYGDFGAWGQAFYDGNQYYNNKNYTYYVRAVRSF